MERPRWSVEQSPAEISGLQRRQLKCFVTDTSSFVLPVVMPGATSSFFLLVAMPFDTSSLNHVLLV